MKQWKNMLVSQKRQSLLESCMDDIVDEVIMVENIGKGRHKADDGSEGV